MTGRGLRGGPSATDTAPPALQSALQQGQHLLGQLVGLRDHGGAGLLQDLCPGQVGGFLREVGVQDA